VSGETTIAEESLSDAANRVRAVMAALFPHDARLGFAAMAMVIGHETGLTPESDVDVHVTKDAVLYFFDLGYHIGREQRAKEESK
jgi:hypothetical protein